MTGELEELLTLLGKHRFTLHEIQSDRDGPEVLAAIRELRGCADVVVMFDQQRACAWRTPRRPGLDLLAPTEVFWVYAANPVWTLRALLTLPPPGHPAATPTGRAGWQLADTDHPPVATSGRVDPVAAPSTRLIRITVAAPRRRMDLALPEDAVVAEVMPELLTRAGEDLADAGLRHGGWVLRRFDGTTLTNTATLAEHRIRDGEVIRLAPRRQEWPELEYDDLVYAIAGGAQRRRRWQPEYTRIAGLTTGAVMVLLGLVAVATAGPDWVAPARWALGQAVLLLVAGILLARVVGDAVAGAVAGLLALPFAFAGGALSQGGTLPLSQFGGPQLLVGCAALTAFGLFGYVAIGNQAWIFASAVAAGVFGLGGGWLGGQAHLTAVEVAAVLTGVLLPLSPLFASVAIRLGKLPLPTLPRTTADLLRNDPQPPRQAVYRAVERADAILTGLLCGASGIAAIGQILLMGSDSTARVLAAIASVGWLLRARLYTVLRQRVPLLVAGLAGPAAALLAGGLGVGASGLVALGAAAVGAGLVYSRRGPGPYLRRLAEFAEVLLILCVVPVACAVLGLYGFLRGLGG